jgi:hypothetical protein
MLSRPLVRGRKEIPQADMEAYKELNKGLPDPFPPGQVRGDPGYTTREKLKRLQEGRMSEEGRLVF